MPRTVECELKDDLIESCIPGDVVTCSGIVKVSKLYSDFMAALCSIFSVYLPLRRTPKIISILYAGFEYR